MRCALGLARRGRGYVEPNPMVGCVMVKHGAVIGKGYHRRYGQAHAEVEALRACSRNGADPAGSDVHVTLEPCAHFGKTPPCADALIDAGVARVFVALADPFEKTAGRGIQKLRDAGITVIENLCHNAARTLNAPYLKRTTTGLPWVIAKWAQTLDGRIAGVDGDSRWISGPTSRRFVHRLRAHVDAIIVGISTVLVDDPMLTARNVPIRRVARRVAIDPQLRIADHMNLLATADALHPVTVAISREVLTTQAARVKTLVKHGVEIVDLPADDRHPSHLQLHPLLAHLAQVHAATNVLVEGGGKLIGSLLEQHLIDQVYAFVAPKLLGDAYGVPVAAGLSRRRIKECDRLKLSAIKRLDDDVLLDYRTGAADVTS